MSRPFLEDASFETLLRLADTYGAEVPPDLTRDQLEEIVAEAIEEWRDEHGQANEHSVRIEETKYLADVAHGAAGAPVDDVDLPESYNETRITLLLRDPGWAFAYWAIKDSITEQLEASERGSGVILRVYSASSAEDLADTAVARFDIPVTTLDNRRYIHLPDQEMIYRIALVASVDGQEQELAVSNAVEVPRGMLLDAPGAADGITQDEILAHTGIRDLDVPPLGRRIPQRVLDLVDEELLFP